MNILAIDSGVEKTGYAICSLDTKYNQHSIITSGLIKTSKQLSLEKRLCIVIAKLTRLIERYSISKIILERIFFFKNQKTVVSVCQAQGAVLYLAGLKNISVTFLTPLQIKQTITGDGVADKKSVQKILKLQFPQFTKFIDDDQSDAIASALAYCYLYKNLIEYKS